MIRIKELRHAVILWLKQNKIHAINSYQDYAGLLVGDDIETSRSMGSDYWAALHSLSKKTDIDDSPELMSSPIDNPA